jgi:hypothetical protein
MGKRKLDFSSPSQSKLSKLSVFGASTNVTPDAKTPSTCIRKVWQSVAQI